MKKTTTMNLINKKDNFLCCKSPITERITKHKPFINKYNWEGINCSSGQDEQKKFEKNNLLPSVFCVPKIKNISCQRFKT